MGELARVAPRHTPSHCDAQFRSTRVESIAPKHRADSRSRSRKASATEPQPLGLYLRGAARSRCEKLRSARFGRARHAARRPSGRSRCSMPCSSSRSSWGHCHGWPFGSFRSSSRFRRACASGAPPSSRSWGSQSGLPVSTPSADSGGHPVSSRRSAPPRHHGALRPRAQPEHGCGARDHLGRGALPRESGGRTPRRRDQRPGSRDGRPRRRARAARALRPALFRLLPKGAALDSAPGSRELSRAHASRRAFSISCQNASTRASMAVSTLFASAGAGRATPRCEDALPLRLRLRIDVARLAVARPEQVRGKPATAASTPEPALRIA